MHTFNISTRLSLVSCAALISVMACDAEVDIADPEPIGDQPAESAVQGAVPPPGEWAPTCLDGDGDLVPACAGPVDHPTDCDDRDADRYPGASELCNGVDDDCDGVIDEYITSCDTAEIPGRPPADVDDDLPAAPPSPHPTPDQWPTGCVDNDLDLVPTCDTETRFATDCDDRDADRYPGASELCNGVDDDCDGVVDEYITSCETAEIPGRPPADAP